MTACLQWLIDFTVSLSLLVALLLLIRRPVARHIGAVTTYRLWLLVPLHLAAPFLFPEGLVIYQVDLSPLTVHPDDTTAIITSASLTGWTVAFLFWLSGLAYTLVHLLLAILGARRLVRESRPLPAEARRELPITGLDSRHVRETFSAGAPIVAGLFRPTLLLPPDFAKRHTPEERRLILAHEAFHMRRRDNLATVAARLCTALFWFNPLVHFAYRAFRTDQELSCDAMVLNGSAMDERKAYGRALVKSAATMETAAVTSSWHNQNHLKERTMMLKCHRHTPLRTIGGLFTLATLSLVAAGLSVNALATGGGMPTGGQTGVSQGPEIIERIPPKYPRDAAENRVEGKVEMQFTVNTDGRVQDVTVLNSEPADIFDAVAVEAIKAWRFEPARKDGGPVPVQTKQTIKFEMD
jgi:TonB family protein